MSDNLSVRAQVESAASTANSTLGRLKKSFRSRGIKLWRILYTTYVRPHLEFAVQAWCPYQKSDINILERVQKRATKVISSIKHLSYNQRLQKLGLTTLETRRLRGDLIEQFKISRGIDEVNFFVPKTKPLSSDTYDLRGHNQRLAKQRVKNCPSRENFFTSRIVNHWNSLSQTAINAPTLNSFKNHVK